MSILSLALVGNPNSGKTSLFNALTQGHQRVGNWPGVTIEQKIGFYFHETQKVEVIDLPGCYSLVSAERAQLDEKVTHTYLSRHPKQLLINVVDSTQLERHLYLTLQLLEQGYSIIVVLNMMDETYSQNISIDIEGLSHALTCPVIPLAATHKQKKNLTDLLKKEIFKHYQNQKHDQRIDYYPTIDRKVLDKLSETARQYGLKLGQLIQALEGDETSIAILQAAGLEMPQLNSFLAPVIPDRHIEDYIARSRYQFITQILEKIYIKNESSETLTEKLDKIILNRVFGIPIFLLIIYSLFLFAIQGGGLLQDWLEPLAEKICIQNIAELANYVNCPKWATLLLSKGVGQGVFITITFIPVIGCMFLFLSLLENSGYMARAAFVMDRLMQMLGLPGHAFVPLIVGFGCNVPAIMGTRTLSNRTERMLTVLMSPFISCGARLTIYAFFVAAFFAEHGHNIIFGLYLFGMMMAIFTAWILKKTILQDVASVLALELPPYRLPSFRILMRQTWHRLKNFVLKAGVLIIPLSCIITGLNLFHAENSLMKLGLSLTPIFEPMGITQNNWPATVGLLTGVVAKEVVVGTLSSLYTLEAGGAGLANQNITLGLIAEKFGSQSAAIAYLLFILLYFPCISVIAVIAKELNKKWALFTVLWTSTIAYTVAVTYYQLATISQHFMYTLSWISGLGIFWCIVYYLTQRLVNIYHSKQPKFISTPIKIINNT